MADEEIKITLLLSEVKDDPRFLRATSNTIRATSASVQNDPLVDSLSYTSPLISSVSDNTPGLFDVRLDLFTILRFTFADSAQVSDLLEEFRISKILSSLAQIDEFVTRFHNIGGAEDLIQSDDEFRYTLDKHPFDIFGVVDSINEDFSVGKSVLNIVNADDPLDTFFEKIALRRLKNKNFPLLPLAESLARPGLLDWTIDKFGTTHYAYGNDSTYASITDGRWSGTDFQGRYLWVSRDHRIEWTRSTNGWITGGFADTVPKFEIGMNWYQTTATLWTGSGAPTDYLGRKWNETGSAIGSTFQGVKYPFIRLPVDSFPRPVEYKPEGSNTWYFLYPKWVVGENADFHPYSEGYVYWWMPGYTDSASGWDSDKINYGQLRARNRGPATSGIPRPFGFFAFVRADSNVGGYPNGSPSGGTDAIVDGPFGPALENIFEPGSLAQIEDFIFELKKRSSHTAEELLQTIELFLNPKAALAFDKITADSTDVRKKTPQSKESAFSPDDLADPKWYPHRRVFDTIDTQELFISPKGQINLSTLKSAINAVKATKVDPLFSTYEVLAKLFNKEVTKGLNDKVNTQDFTLSPKSHIQFDMLSTLMRVEKLRTKGFDFKFKLANEFQEIDFIKSLIEDVDSVSDLVVAGKALQLREKAEVKEEAKKKTAEFPEDLLDFTDSSNYLLDKGVFFDIEKITELVLAGKDLDFLDKINVVPEERKKFGANSNADTIVALSLVRAKKLEILQEGEDFFQAIAPLITKPAIARLKTSRIKIQDFLKFDPDFGVESINLFGNADFHQIFTSLFDIHENVDTKERLLYKAKAPKVQFDVSKVAADRDTLSPNKALISSVAEPDDTFDPFLFRKNALESKGNYKSKPIFTGQAQTIFEILRLKQDLSNIDFVKAAISDVEKIDDTVHPLFFTRGLEEDKAFVQNLILRPLARLLNEKIFFADLDFSTIPFKGLENIANIGDFPTLHHERKRVFDDKFSGSIKGAAFVRDEEYVTGAYFLEPYVATIPPGRSRQF